MDLIDRNYLLNLLEKELKKDKHTEDFEEGFNAAISVVEYAFVEDIKEILKSDNPYQE